MSITEVLERGLPSLGQGSTASNSSESGSGSTSSSSYSTPTITPPSIAGNPHIWRSGKPAGTVFIAMGSVVGFILAAIVLMYFVSAYISHRNAKKQRYDAIDHEFQAHISKSAGTEFFNSEKNQYSDKLSSQMPMLSNHSMVRMLDPQGPERLSPSITNMGSQLTVAQEPYSLLQGQNAAAQNRQSLFISPTVEVVNQQRRSMFMPGTNASSSSLVSEISPELNRPERAASPERKKGHQARSKSNLGSTVASAKSSSPSPENSQARATPFQRAEAPSMYLEKLLEDD
ncbi:LAME_0D05688g1_1 [Lachancea meyersii CBS 8951]|uniref:LAME_0D05688g1_1 n=1 Tax=Lachancea meyersii CBS 8951 TaxID=1266667 RepID=A0A1G4J8X7_9SACH|nr:LAME_0D05688g1_1 [Lachancea meyersii CBS 8951]